MSLGKTIKKVAIPAVLGLIGLVALWPSIEIVMWSLINGGFIGPLQGILLSAISGPLGGAFLVGAFWVRSSRDSSDSA